MNRERERERIPELLLSSLTQLSFFKTFLFISLCTFSRFLSLLSPIFPLKKAFSYLMPSD